MHISPHLQPPSSLWGNCVLLTAALGILNLAWIEVSELPAFLVPIFVCLFFKEERNNLSKEVHLLELILDLRKKDQWKALGALRQLFLSTPKMISL